MGMTNLLSTEEFEACSVAPMQDVTADADSKADIWPYVDGLALDSLGLPNLNDVHYVYRDALNRYDQVLIGTGRFNTLLVIVVDRARETVLGHYLLDLNEKYDVRIGHLRVVR